MVYFHQQHKLPGIKFTNDNDWLVWHWPGYILAAV
jgi:hypothetical protein